MATLSSGPADPSSVMVPAPVCGHWCQDILSFSFWLDWRSYLNPTPQRRKQLQVILTAHQSRHIHYRRLLHPRQTRETRLAEERPSNVLVRVRRPLEGLPVAGEVELVELCAVARGAEFAVVAFAAEGEGEEHRVPGLDVRDFGSDGLDVAGSWRS